MALFPVGVPAEDQSRPDDRLVEPAPQALSRSSSPATASARRPTISYVEHGLGSEVQGS
jgi:hypothetical protein